MDLLEVRELAKQILLYNSDSMIGGNIGDTSGANNSKLARAALKLCNDLISLKAEYTTLKTYCNEMAEEYEKAKQRISHLINTIDMLNTVGQTLRNEVEQLQKGSK